MDTMKTVAVGKSDFLDNLPDSDAAAAIRAGVALGGLTNFDMNGIPHVAVPDGVGIVSMEKTLPMPTRIQSNRTFEEPGSFCKYVEAFKNTATRLYGIPDNFNFAAFINDDEPEKPSWNEHLAGLQLKKSPEWNEWMEAAGKSLTQRDLANFFEDHIEQIAEPDAADLLSDIRSIFISSGTKCESVQHEGGDIAFTYATETAAGTKTERGKIPSRLTLLIAPFRSWHPVQMTVALTYALTKEKELKFVMRPHQAEALMWQSFNDVRKHVEDTLSLPVLV